METRRLQYRKYAALYLEPDEPDPLLDQAAVCSNLYDDGQQITSINNTVSSQETITKHQAALNAWQQLSAA